MRYGDRSVVALVMGLLVLSCQETKSDDDDKNNGGVIAPTLAGSLTHWVESRVRLAQHCPDDFPFHTLAEARIFGNTFVDGYYRPKLLEAHQRGLRVDLTALGQCLRETTCPNRKDIHSRVIPSRLSDIQQYWFSFASCAQQIVLPSQDGGVCLVLDELFDKDHSDHFDHYGCMSVWCQPQSSQDSWSRDGRIGQCLPTPKVGDACGDDRDCDWTNSRCDTETGKCVLRQGTDEPCTYGGDCIFEYYCDTSKHTCQPSKKENEPCESSDECVLIDLFPNYGYPLHVSNRHYCDANSQTCQPRGKTGAICLSDKNLCYEGYYCDAATNTCQAEASREGAECLAYGGVDPCPPGLYCVPGARKNMHTCQKQKGLGQECENFSHHACGSGWCLGSTEDSYFGRVCTRLFTGTGASEPLLETIGGVLVDIVTSRLADCCNDAEMDYLTWIDPVGLRARVFAWVSTSLLRLYELEQRGSVDVSRLDEIPRMSSCEPVLPQAFSSGVYTNWDRYLKPILGSYVQSLRVDQEECEDDLGGG